MGRWVLGEGGTGKSFQSPRPKGGSPSPHLPVRHCFAFEFAVGWAGNHASCSSLAKVQCLFWLLSEARPRESVERRPGTVQNLT